MEFDEVVRRRRMVRRYSDVEVDEAALTRVLDRARRAPSAGHSQAVAFVVVRDAGRRAEIARVCGEEAAVARGLPRWISTAPVLVVPCVDPGAYERRYAEPDKDGSVSPARRAVPWHWVDAGQSLMLLLLAAVDEGLGAGLLDVDDRDGLRQVIAIPAEVEPLGVVTLGVPAAEARPGGSATRPRVPLEEQVRRERW